MSEKAKITYKPDGSMSIEHPQALDEREFIFIVAEHFLGEQAAWELLKYHDGDESETELPFVEPIYETDC